MKKILFLLLLSIFSFNVLAQGPSKKCSTCGKSIAACQYRGKHPKSESKCPTCNKTIEKCKYKGKHPIHEAAGYDVTFICNIPSASLYIDGNASGNASGSRFLKTGQHDIKIISEGYEDYTTSINVRKSNKEFSFFLNIIDTEQLYAKGNDFYNKKDYTEAVKWYRMAADKGYAKAQNDLGYCYKKGYGVSIDYTEAVKWYRLAADQGNASAQCNLGYCYEAGQGVSQNYTEAVKWYRMAADQGYAHAQCNLGYCYEAGQGVSQNYTEAVKWYRMAADQGNATAKNNLTILQERNQTVSHNNDDSKKWYKKVADKGKKITEKLAKKINSLNGRRK